MNYCKVDNCVNPEVHVTSGHKCEQCGNYGHGKLECENIEKINNLKSNFYHERLPKNKWCLVHGCKHFWQHTSSYHYCGEFFENSDNIDNNSYISYENNIEQAVNDITDNNNMENDIFSTDSDNSILNDIPVTDISSDELTVDLSTDSSNISEETILSDESELLSTSILISDTPEELNTIEINNFEIVKLNCPICRKNNNIFFDKHRAYGLDTKCNVCLTNNIEIFLPDCGHTILCRNCCVKIGEVIGSTKNTETYYPSPTCPPDFNNYYSVPSPVPSPASLEYYNNTTYYPTPSPDLYANDTTYYPTNISPIPTPTPSPSVSYISDLPLPDPITITNTHENDV